MPARSVSRSTSLRGRRRARLLLCSLLTAVTSVGLVPSQAYATTTAVTLAGSLQSELGCSGDWDPSCTNSDLSLGTDGVWKAGYTLPAGSYEYKAALNHSWDENYGAHAQLSGDNIALSLPSSSLVHFYYDDTTHWVADDVNAVIATAAGNFQSELGCAGDWIPSCMRSWLQDPDGDGTYSFVTTALPAGSYSAKVAIDNAWDENYGAGGTPNGANIDFTVTTSNAPTEFRYDATSHVLTIGRPATTAVTLAGSLQSELGCSGDWDPSCTNFDLSLGTDGVWKAGYTLPAGSYEYKAALNHSWDENYGAHAQLSGDNIALSLPSSSLVHFYYDDTTHWVADDVNAVIATAAGNFQSELGCAGDWIPSCMRSWLQDPDGDGTYSFVTTALPAGSYSAKVAIDNAWDENYGAGGTPNGANIDFTVPAAGVPIEFVYAATTHILTIGPSVTVTAPNGGERLRRGTTTTITWTHVGAVPVNAEVDLLRKGKLYRVLSASTPTSSGSYTWQIPESLAGGKGFRVLVKAVGTGWTVSDQSDAEFSIQ